MGLGQGRDVGSLVPAVPSVPNTVIPSTQMPHCEDLLNEWMKKRDSHNYSGCNIGGIH